MTTEVKQWTAEKARKLSDEKNAQLHEQLKIIFDDLIEKAVAEGDYEAYWYGPNENGVQGLERYIEDVYKPNKFKISYEYKDRILKQFKYCIISW